MFILKCISSIFNNVDFKTQVSVIFSQPTKLNGLILVKNVENDLNATIL